MPPPALPPDGKVRIRPTTAPQWVELAAAQLEAGDLAAALESFDQAIAIDPKYLQARSGRLLALHYQPLFDPTEVFAEHARFGEMLADVPRMMLPSIDKNPDRRLRIGYVGANLDDAFITPLLTHHDTRHFELFRYDDIADVTDDALSDMIADDDRIDILVDLAGHTPGNRLAVFARKPAPLQFTYLGYPDTTGLKAIDYRITDTIADPPATTSALHVEHVLRLPRCAWCWQRPGDLPDVGALPAAHNQFITFGTHAEPAKVNAGVMDAWAAILKGVEHSRLRVMHSSFAGAGVRERFRAQFLRRGVADRVELIRGGTNPREQLAAYQRIDIALDTFPFNGCGATCEALWMGAPVVSLAGHVHACRIGASLLDAVGMSDWVMRSPEQYIARAVAAAADISALAQLRAGLRQRVQNSPLTNDRTLAHAIESLYRHAWRQYCA